MLFALSTGFTAIEIFIAIKVNWIAFCRTTVSGNIWEATTTIDTVVCWIVFRGLDSKTVPILSPILELFALNSNFVFS